MAGVSLEKRVQTLENKLWVAGAVAVIFGVSGAWGFSALHEAQTQLSELQKGVQAVKDARDAALADLKQAKENQIVDFNRQAKGIAKQAITDEMAAKFFKVPFSTLATLTNNCNSGANSASIACASGAQLFCQSKGFAGGIPQQDFGPDLGVVCVR
jgi:hypothetical protein